jgi:hypothetical protein
LSEGGFVREESGFGRGIAAEGGREGDRGGVESEEARGGVECEEESV